MDNIKNISTAKSGEQYYGIAAEIAKKYPDYAIEVDGGPYRNYCVRYEIDRENKTIKLDYYIPMHINTKVCNRWVLSEIAKGNTSGSAGLGLRKAAMTLMGNNVEITKFDRIPALSEHKWITDEYDKTFTKTENGFRLSFSKRN